ncbi:MAG TPA: hypothetical protein VGD40_04605 [Chryseosolibacter sp.]
MKKAFLVAFVLISNMGFAQTDNFWQVLAEVSFKSEQDKAGYTIERPIFSKYLKTFQGKKVKLKGYIIPLEESGGKGKFMLSSLPFNICYFCGAAGPETVVEVQTTENVKFTTKQIIMEGTLHLNDTDPDHHIYILKSANLTKKI